MSVSSHLPKAVDSGVSAVSREVEKRVLIPEDAAFSGDGI